MVREALLAQQCQRLFTTCHITPSTAHICHRYAALSISSCRNLSGSPLKRAWRQGRVVANAQVGDFLILLLKVLLSQRIELCAVFFFDGGSLAIELLDLVEPGDSIADPGVGGFEAVLEVATLVSITLRRCIMMAAPGSFNLSSGCRLLLVPFPLHRSSTAATALPITKLSHAP